MFQQLPEAEQVARLTAFAQRALAHWEGHPGHAVHLQLYGNNAVFTYLAGAARYGLRVYRPGQRPRQQIEGEWRWLAALAQYPALAPDIPTQQYPIYSGVLSGYDGPAYAVAWRWLPGEPLPLASYTPAHTRQLGDLLARLHLAALDVRGTPTEASITRPRLDYEGLFGARSPYDPGDGTRHISQQSAQTLAAVAEQVRQVMDWLDTQPDTFGLIHGDLIYKNTLFSGQGAQALDFEDCGFGYLLYDLAVPLLFYRGQPTYNTLKDALWEGYTARRPLPGSYRPHLETLIAGRYVASCRWVAGHADHPTLRGRARDVIDDRAAELRAYLQTGAL